VNYHDVRRAALGEASSHRVRSCGATDNDDVGSFAFPAVGSRDHEYYSLSDIATTLHAEGGQGVSIELRKLLETTEAFTTTAGHHDGRDGHD
jgi:hypothetical protein